MEWLLTALGLGVIGYAVTRRPPSSPAADVDELRTGDPDYDVYDQVIAAALDRVDPDADLEFKRLAKTIAYHESGAWRYARAVHPGQTEDAGLMGLRLRYFEGQPFNVEGFTRDQIITDPRVNALLGVRLLRSYWQPASLDRLEVAASKYAAGPGAEVIRYGRERARDVHTWWS